MVFNQSLSQMVNATFDGLSEQSRIWIWQSNRVLSEEECSKGKTAISEFASQWVSHNRALVAKADILCNRFWVVALDQSAGAGASGCSIDSLTQAVQSIAASIEVDVLDRTKFCFYKDEQIVVVPMSDLSGAIADGYILDTDLVFDNLVKTKAELSSTWLKPLKDSWHKRFA